VIVVIVILTGGGEKSVSAVTAVEKL